ncbi:MAG TPA: fumarylacetoacetate hydrolase family protein [Xanthobacteraceae bacterium]|nr:fumarylacetoacetate hydrolase family protein [Xanthobacteraceae bacterium]
MKICRFNDSRIGVVRAGHVHDVTAILDDLPNLRYPLPLGDQLIASLESLRAKIGQLADRAAPIPFSQVRFCAPVANPSKIIGVPSNYPAHVAEVLNDKEIRPTNAGKPSLPIDKQGLFLKANSALVGPGEGVAIRFPDRRTDHECELGLIISRQGSDIPEQDAMSYVAGYALALDMVVRGPEDRSFRKSADSYAVLGPWMVTADEIADPQSLDFELSVNGEIRQQGNTRDMTCKIAKQIAWASSFYTLYPGDVIMTGTNDGVGRVQPGDVITVEYAKVGRMEVPVRAHQR